MEKGKKIEAEFQLPEAILQHIQSFLSGKEAAQTTLLSKSWYNAWLTRPNLEFDEHDFRRESRESSFWEFMKKTVERYEKLNLKVDSLRLWIHGSSDAKKCNYTVVKDLIAKALKMGATGLDFKFYYSYRPFTLPHEVFESEKLIRLSLSNCRIGLGVDGKVSCSRLKYLTLDEVRAEGDIIWHIISSCPLIEKIALNQYSHFKRINVGSVVDSPFSKLKCLTMSSVNVHTLFFDALSSKFPCLKDLALRFCDGYKVIQITSPSLECITFAHDKVLKVEFDVPNIRKFAFLGSSIPSLSFKTTTSTWESDISIQHGCRPPTTTWFLKLNKLLKKLSTSKISLRLKIMSNRRLDCAANIPGLPKPKVENLTIDGPYSICPALFCSLFRCCRPIYISQNWFPHSFGMGRGNYDMMKFVNKRMMHQVSLNSCIAYQRMSGESDLKDVNVEFYDESVSAWQPRLLDASTSLEADEQRIRLHLRWGR